MYKMAKIWYQSPLNFFCLLLLPVSWLYRFFLNLRYWCYRFNILKSFSFPCPVIVVGNITVGGTGKTPMVIYLAQYLRNNGWRPGIVSRGVGGNHAHQVIRVDEHSTPQDVGDEALLLQQRTGCPVMVCVNRPQAVRALLQATDCNVIISDDGLQHYALKRDIEILMVDGARLFGNQQLLPAGPLRESMQRLENVDFKILKNNSDPNYYSMRVGGEKFVSLSSSEKIVPASFFGQHKVHAIAAISDPENFFRTLEKLGLSIIRHEYPDHYQFKATDLNFNDDYPIIMTEKDMVKCKGWANTSCWYLPVNVEMDIGFEKALKAKLALFPT